MEDTVPSRTAWTVALQRAAHQFLEERQVFTDPLAVPIVGSEGMARIQENMQRYRQGLSLRTRASVVARSRFSDETMIEAAGRGVTQFVLLGAGLDTFPYRQRLPNESRIVEIDHPATQAWKRRRLAAAGIRELASVVFVPHDFNAAPLELALRRGGLDLARPVVFSWLGVTYYLPAAEVITTLRLVSTLRHAEIVFDYFLPADMLHPAARNAYEHLAERSAAVGEPYRSAFAPEALATDLRRLGFERILDLSPEDVAGLYFSEQPPHFQPSARSRLIRAGTGGTTG